MAAGLKVRSGGHQQTGLHSKAGNAVDEVVGAIPGLGHLSGLASDQERGGGDVVVPLTAIEDIDADEIEVLNPPASERRRSCSMQPGSGRKLLARTVSTKRLLHFTNVAGNSGSKHDQRICQPALRVSVDTVKAQVSQPARLANPWPMPTRAGRFLPPRSSTRWVERQAVAEDPVLTEHAGKSTADRAQPGADTSGEGTTTI
jgi:hypothetical protein